MQKRHFIVKETNGDYQLKEIDPTIAKAMGLFGIIMGEYYHTVEASNWFFYFMNCSISSKDANKIAEQLSQQLLQGEQ